MAMAAASSRPWKIAIVGHSHVYRMDASAVNGNNFHLSNVETAFFSRGGLRVPNLFGADILQPLMAFEPDAVVFLVGDNDIQPFSAPQDICDNILAAIEAIIPSCPSIRFVALSQILPRYPGTSLYLFDGYNEIAYRANNLLLESCIASPILRFGFYPEFCFRDYNEDLFNKNSKFFLPDGVHLNQRGYKKLASRIKGLIIGLISRLRGRV